MEEAQIVTKEMKRKSAAKKKKLKTKERPHRPVSPEVQDEQLVQPEPECQPAQSQQPNSYSINIEDIKLEPLDFDIGGVS